MAYITTTIANGTSLSPVIDLSYRGNTIKPRLFRIDMPATWTTAALTFQAAETVDGTYRNMYDQNGLEVTVQAGTSRTISLDPVIFASIQFLKIRSGTSSSAVNQGGDRILSIVAREV